uniref:Lipocalin n=1 Tax=Rhipicephalus appendiculatus TaxID=34631 RepID=A0A131YVH8_RHIAP
MYHVLLAILFPFLVSSQDAPRVFLKMWHLYDLLNTTNKIWILSTSQPALYENEEVTCINYRAKNLTTRSVTSIYQVVWKEEVHRGIMVKARLLDYRYPSMTRRDWNAARWCEVHVRGPELRAAYNRSWHSTYTACDAKFYELCENKAQIMLASRNCPNLNFNNNQPTYWITYR